MSEGVPTPTPEQPTAAEPSKDAPARIAELERLVRGLEQYITKKDEQISDLENENAELTALNKRLRDPKHVEELERLAFSDELTGVFSRRGLERQAKLAITHQMERLRDLKRAGGDERRQEAKNQEFLSFIMLDIDHFKKVNDTHGHATGDVVLRKVGEVLGKSIRGDDFAGRWGGEEFILCITSPNENIRRQVAERLRRAISEIDAVNDEGEKVPVTASFGIANWEEGDMLEDTVRRADEALYVAKNAGRDQVVTEQRESGKSFYLTRYSDDPISKTDIKEFLKAKVAK